MSLHDISLKLAGDTVRWVTAPPFELEERRRMSKGDPNNSSALNMSGHSGTHIDAPFHFVAEGLTIDELPRDRFIGPGLVFEVDAARYITKEHVESIKLDGATRVLFKTRNSELLHQREYEPDFAAFSVEAAQSLVEQGVELVGLDYLSIAHADEQVPVHRAFLDHGVVLLEGIDLSHVAPGRYELMCLPIQIGDSDGAPCRAVLRDL
ncbi:MAG: cyclase [Dehalococcoidia bacterium]|nr:cyclase [Dehalococcoidia bacterium]